MENKSEDTVKAWADIVIQRFESRIVKLNVVETSELLKSFTSQVTLDAAGDPVKIVFTFLYYGIFPDMGVGKGVKYDQVSGSNRQPKPWYSKQLAAEVSKLGRIMAEKYGVRAQNAIRLIENRTSNEFNDEAWKNSTYNK